MAVQIEIFVKGIKIDESSIGNPPIRGAKIYAGTPGRVLEVLDVILVGNVYRLDCRDVKNAS